MKYDDGHPSGLMTMRALITAVVVLVSSLAEGQPLKPRQPWHAVVTPPRATLPAVTIDLGYPGPYVPSQNSPITLRATAADRPFNGYIGFGFRVNEKRTYDTPVIARAVLRPHQTWTFSTFVSLRRLVGPGQDTVPREIAIEWRDVSMNVTGVRSAGVPPWTPWRTPTVPLRIGARTTAETSALGRGAYSEQAGALPDRAQWYAGFSDVVAPLEVWLDLPRPVREAILGSGINVVFFGLPRSGQKLDDIDATLLPVTFEAKPGSYRVPWPYGNDAVATPLSWALKDGSTGVGSGPLPYMVRSAVVTWVADENGTNHPLPATAAIPIPLHSTTDRSSTVDSDRQIAVAWPRPAQFLRMYTALPLTLAASVVCLAGWLILRRRPRVAMTVALLISATIVLAARERIRPPSGVYQYDVQTALSPGIVGRLHLLRSYGPTPIPEEQVDPETVRAGVSGASELWGEAEVRTSDTPVFMGRLQRRNDWNAVTRWARRRVLGEGPLVRIRSREGKALAVDYETAQPINYVYAEWLCGENRCWGETAVRPGTQGSATIRNQHRAWPEAEPFVSRIPESTFTRASRTHVWLVRKTRTSTRIFEWLERRGNGQPGSFLITDRKMLMNGSANFAFALPREVSPNATALVSATRNRPSVAVKLVWVTGSAMLAPTGRDGFPGATRSYLVPTEAFREIVASGGIVNVTMSSDPRASINPFEALSIEIREKKP